MLLLNHEINLVLTWLANCVISAATGATAYAKLNVSVVCLLTKNNSNYCNN